MATEQTGSTEVLQQSTNMRAGKRFALLLRVGKLITPQGEFLCVLRDVSGGGLKARLFHDLPESGSYHLELGGGERYALERVWQRDGHAGFRFAAGWVAVLRLIEEAGPFPKRQIRLNLREPWPIMLITGGLNQPALLRDISQYGAAVDIDPRLALRQQVRIDAAGLPSLHARVRWRRGSLHGLVFQESFRVDELARLTACMQLGEARLVEPPGTRTKNRA